MSALLLACSTGVSDVVQLLCQQNADIMKKDKKGRGALQLARSVADENQKLVGWLTRLDPELKMTEEELEHLRGRIHIYSPMAIVVLTWRAPDEQPAISHTEDAESAISHTELILSESAFYFERHEAIETHPCKRAARCVSFRCRRAWNDRRLLAPATSSLSSFAGLFVIAPRPLFCLSSLSLPCSW